MASLGNQAVLRLRESPVAVSGAGRSLEEGTRGFFERLLGHELGDVRIHTDSAASRATHRMGARAYSAAPHIVFREGAYSPHTAAGLRLLAHELTHVVQQTRRGPSDAAWSSSDRRPDAAEHEADRIADLAAEGRPAPAIDSPAAAVALQDAEAGTVEEPGTFASAKGWVYQALIESLRGAQARQIGILRAVASALPPSFQAATGTILDVVETVTDLSISLVLAIVGLLGGIVTGLWDMVKGVFLMAAGLLTGVMLFLDGINRLDPGPFLIWLDDVVTAIVGIPSALKALVTNWWNAITSAPPDRQTIMIGEFFGQIIALLIPFTWAGKAGAAGRVAAVGEEIAGGGGGGAEVINLAAVRAASAPAVELASGRSASTVASVSEGVSLPTRGGAALRAVPEIVEVPVPAIVEVPLPAKVIPIGVPFRAPVPPPALGGLSRGAKAVIVAGADAASVGQKLAKKRAPPGEEEPERPKSMRSQIQRGAEHLGSAAVIAVNADRGVTAFEFEQFAMLGALADYKRPAGPNEKRPRRPKENEPRIKSAFISQSQRIRAEIIPAGGVTQGGDINSLREKFRDSETGAEVRVDVENSFGHNLRYPR